MPLTTCPDCRREISDTAPNCPHCGRPMLVNPPPQGAAEPTMRVKTTEDSFLTRNRGCADLIIWPALLVLLLGLLVAVFG